MLFAASEKIQTDVMSAISVPNEDVELVVKVKDHNQGSDTYKEIFSYEIPAKEQESAAPVLPQASVPVQPASAVPKVSATPGIFVATPAAAEPPKPALPEIKSNLTLSVVDSAKAAAAVVPVEKSKVESAVIATLEKAKEQMKGNTSRSALTDMAKSIESTLSNDTVNATKIALPVVKASTPSTSDVVSKTIELAKKNAEHPPVSDVVTKTIALAKQNADHGPVASDVISRTIALAKEKEVRKSHPLTGGLSGLLGNSEEAIQVKEDGFNGTAKNTTVTNKNQTLPANATTVPKRKNNTIPDGSKEPVKPELGNSSSNSSAKASNVSAKVDKVFEDAAKMPEHSHDGIKDTNSSSNLTSNVTVSQKHESKVSQKVQNWGSLAQNNSSPKKAENMTAKVDKAFKDAEKLPENENHGIKDKLYNVNWDKTKSSAPVKNATLPAKNDTKEPERWIKVNGTRVNDTSEQNKKVATPMKA